MMPSVNIRLPQEFKQAHEEAVIAYLAGTLGGQNAWRQAFIAFDLLDKAVFVQGETEQTFRVFYRRMVEDLFADDYLHKLLALPDVKSLNPFALKRRITNLWLLSILNGNGGFYDYRKRQNE